MAVLVAALGSSREAAAQTCTDLENLCVNQRPQIAISPPGGTILDTQRYPVTITWRDNTLNAASRSIKVNDVEVKDSFTYYVPNGTMATSTGQVPLSASGPTTLSAHICDLSGLCADEAVVFTYGGTTAQQYGPAAVSLGLQHQGVRVVSPGEATAGYSTPAYVSQDVSRSVSLVYTTGQAAAQAFVQVDAYNGSTVHPTRMSILVRDSATGATVAEGWYLWRDGYNRLAARWNAPGLGNAARTYDVAVRSHWEVARGAPKDTTLETTRRVRVLILDESASPYGVGWSVAGLQRLYRTGGGAMVTNGDGTAVFFTQLFSTFTSPDGEFSTLREDAAQGLVTRFYPDSSRAVFASSTGRLQYVRDRFGNQTTYGYDTSGRLWTITDPVGKVTTLTYNGPNNYPHSNKLATIVDPGGRTTYFGYWDGWDNLTTIQDPAVGISVAATYQNPGGILKTLSGRDGGISGFAYDAAGMLAADTLPPVQANGAVQRPVMRMRSWELASLGGTSAAPAAAIDPDTLHLDVTDPRGYTTRSTLDAYRLPLRVIGPTGDTTVFRRNAAGQPYEVASPSGAITGYDWEGPRLLGTYDSDPVTFTQAEYAAASEPTLVTSGGVEIHNRYGSRGQLLRSWVGSDSTRATVYAYAPDSSYRVASITDPQGHRTELTYEATGFKNLASVTAPDAGGTPQTTSYTHDGHGRTASITDPDGTSSLAYDVLNRLTQSVNARGDTTWTALSGADTVTTVTDAAHKAYTFYRNRLGWLLSETDPNGRTRSYAYDLAGNATSQTDRRGRTVTLTYDTLSRVRTRLADGVTTTFSYGAPRDSWAAAVSSATNDTIRFDRQGRPVVEVSVIGGTRYARTSHYRPEGVRDTLVYTTPAGSRTVSFGYDTELRLHRLTGPGGSTDSTHIGYDAEGMATSVRFPTGLTQTASYLPNHAPETQSWSAGAVNGAFYREWTYDPQDRVATRSDGSRMREYEYDPIGQLTARNDWHSSLGPLVCDDPLVPSSCHHELIWSQDSTAAYTYDRVHNRSDNGATLQATSNRYATFGGYTLGYDDEGNLTSKTKTGYSQTYTWNDLGQLASVTTNGATVSYVYNGFGQRVKRTEGSAVTWSVYDGDDLLLELDGSGAVLREYTMYPGIDAPHSVRTWSGTTPGSANYYVMEQPGHVTGLVNSSSQVANQYTYTPWGQAESTMETVPQPLHFMAREYDATTSLYYVRARWYDPSLARFNSEDPIGLDGGMNSYVYVGNSPPNFRDLSGLGPCRGNVTIGAVGAVAPNVGGVITKCIHHLGGFEGALPESMRNDAGEEQHGPSALDRFLWGKSGRFDLAREVMQAPLVIQSQCVAETIGLSSLASWAGAMSIDKRARGIPVVGSASEETNALNYYSRIVGGRIFGRRIRLPFRILGSRSPYTAAGRANVVLARGLLVYNAILIAKCETDKSMG